MAAAAAPSPRRQASHAATAHAWGTRPGQGTPSVFSTGRGNYVQREEGRVWPGTPPLHLIQPGDQSAQQLQTQHSWPRPTHPVPISGGREMGGR